MGEETKAAGKGAGRADKKKDAGAAAVEPQPIVLKVDLHCLGCARKVRKAIKRAPGVESVATDVAEGKVVVTGPADAAELKERIEARTKKPVQIVSTGAGPPKKEKAEKEKGGGGDKKKAADKPDKEVTLQVQVHCDTCIGRLKRRNSKIKVDMVIDADKDTVKVTGTIDAAALPAYLRDKVNRTTEVVKKDGGGGNKKDKGAGDGADKKKDRGGEEKKDKPAVAAAAAASVFPTPMGDAGMYQLMPPQYGYTPFALVPGGPPPNYRAFYDNARYSPPSYPYAAHLHAPLTFSDENPNACSVM